MTFMRQFGDLNIAWMLYGDIKKLLLINKYNGYGVFLLNLKG